MHPGPVCPGPAPLGVTPWVPSPPSSFRRSRGLAPGERRVGAGTAGEQLWHQTVPSLLPRPLPGLPAAVSRYGVLECLSYARKDTSKPYGGIPFAVAPGSCRISLGGVWSAERPKAGVGVGV
jgi:hypothetical protein